MIVYIIMFLVSEAFGYGAIRLSAKKAAKHSIKIHFNGKKLQIMKSKRLVPQKYNMYLLWLSALPFFLVAALRYNVGTDYQTYLKLQIPAVMAGTDYGNEKVEFLYRIVIRLGMSLGDAQFVFVITHFLIILFVWLHIKDYSENLLWSIFVFMFGCSFNMSLNIMRQYIAITICFYALKYIYEKNLLKYVILVGIAALFHKVSIVFLLFYWLSKVKMTRWMPVFIAAACTVLSSLIRVVLILVSKYLNFYTNYFGSVFDNNDLQWDLFLFNFAILILGCYCVGDPSKLSGSSSQPENYEKQAGTLNALQMATASFAGMSAIIPNSTRIIMMFAIGQVTYIPMILNRTKKRKFDYLFFMAVTILMYLFIFWRVIISRGVGETLPYRFYSFF